VLEADQFCERALSRLLATLKDHSLIRDEHRPRIDGRGCRRTLHQVTPSHTDAVADRTAMYAPDGDRGTLGMTLPLARTPLPLNQVSSGHLVEDRLIRFEHDLI